MVIEGTEYEIRIGDTVYHSALDLTMSFVGGRWKTVVLWYLRSGAKRFGELNRLIPNITEKMLSLQLKQLENDGIVRREVFSEVPPRVEYSLTVQGQTLLPILEAMAAWGRSKAKQHSANVEIPMARRKRMHGKAAIKR
jgi:DNA-binding HxlR family transcriptional regulator